MGNQNNPLVVGRINLRGYRCERCGHQWFPRKYDEKTKGLPVLCPKCKSAYWDRPKEKKVKK